jgi:hypothetical protein
MNRQLKAGALGLCVLWLQRGHARLSRCDHELEKEALSSADALNPRREARRLFRARAADSPDVSELVELEARIRGGYVEPSTLSCPSLHKTLERLMNDPDNSLVPEASEPLVFFDVQRCMQPWHGGYESRSMLANTHTV